MSDVGKGDIKVVATWEALLHIIQHARIEECDRTGLWGGIHEVHSMRNTAGWRRLSGI